MKTKLFLAVVTMLTFASCNQVETIEPNRSSNVINNNTHSSSVIQEEIDLIKGEDKTVLFDSICETCEHID